MAFDIAHEDGAGRQRSPRAEEGHGLVQREVVEEHGRKDIIEAARTEWEPHRVGLDNVDLGKATARGSRMVDHLRILVHADDVEVDAGSPGPRHQGAGDVRSPAAHVQKAETLTPVARE